MINTRGSPRLPLKAVPFTPDEVRTGIIQAIDHKDYFLRATIVAIATAWLFVLTGVTHRAIDPLPPAVQQTATK